MTEFKIYGDWEATPDTLVPIHAREYYYDEHGNYLVQDWIIQKWCRENGIRARGYSAGGDENYKFLWSVPDPEHRVLFSLRWS